MVVLAIRVRAALGKRRRKDHAQSRLTLEKARLAAHSRGAKLPIEPKQKLLEPFQRLHFCGISVSTTPNPLPSPQKGILVPSWCRWPRVIIDFGRALLGGKLSCIGCLDERQGVVILVQ